MRKFLYLTLIDHLKGLTDKAGEPVIHTFDLWNEQVEFIEQEEVFDTPAIFIEFRPMQWVTLGGGAQQTDATIRLHIITPWDGSARSGSVCQQQALQRFDLLDSIDRHLFNLQARDETTTVAMFRRTGSSTNHNHEELVEDITDYTCKITEIIRTS